MSLQLNFSLNKDESSYTLLGPVDNDSVTRLVIPSEYEGKPVTAIANEAFSGPCMKFPCEDLEEVVIPASIETIGFSAFGCCENLSSVTFEEGSRLRAIWDNAFYYCVRLKKIEIPESVKTLSLRAFSNCHSLKEIVLPMGIKNVSGAPSRCRALRYNAYDNALYLGSLDNSYLVLIEAKDKEIASCEVHKDCKFIVSSAFSECKKLESVSLSAGLISIDGVAFLNDSGLTSIHFGGTKDEWNAISKSNYWDTGTGNYTVHCTDGDLEK